jgi:multidrug resistance efflux pump
MVIVSLLYGLLVYLLCFKFKIVPWNKVTQYVVVLIGVIILTGFLVGLQGLTPSSTQAAITGRLAEIAPEVTGRVTRVVIQPNVPVESGDVLFEIDPTPYQASVDELNARLELARLRLGQYQELAEQSAGSRFQLEQAQYDVEQLEAQLVRAEFNLANTTVRASDPGIVPRNFLEQGSQVVAGRAVMTFVDTSRLSIVGQFQQKALQHVKEGDRALVNFPALPGRVFETEVVAVPSAIGDAQVLASGQLPSIQQAQMTRLYPIYIAIPEDFPADLEKMGLAATVYIHTEGAGVVGIVAIVLQWVGTSLDAVL